AESGPDMSTWTGEHFQVFLAKRVERGLHVNTVRKYANQLRSFFAWCYATQRLTADQYLQLKSIGNPKGSTNQSTPKPYSRAELERFWHDLNDNHPVPANIANLRKRWVRGTSPWRSVAKYGLRLQIEAIVA